MGWSVLTRGVYAITSLRFINDLLRTMLDMHRASSGNLQVKLAPVDLLRDVLEPVAGMLHRGGEGSIGEGGGKIGGRKGSGDGSGGSDSNGSGKGGAGGGASIGGRGDGNGYGDGKDG